MSVYIKNVKLDEIEESQPINSPRSLSINSQKSIHSYQAYQTTAFAVLSPIQKTNLKQSQSYHHLRRSSLIEKLDLNESTNSELTNQADIQNSPNKFQVKEIMITCSPKDKLKTFNSNWLNINENNKTQNSFQVPSQPNIKDNKNIKIIPKVNNSNNYNHIKNASTLSIDTINMQTSNFPLIQGHNLLKNPMTIKEISFDFSQQLINLNFERIVELFDRNRLFSLIQFLNGDDLGYLLDTCKKMRNIIEYTIETNYLQKMIHRIKNNNSFFEILSTKLNYIKLKKKAIKIDYVTTIRFKNIFAGLTPYQRKVTNLGISFLYKNFSTKRTRFVDYYSLDLVPFNGITPTIFMTREFTTFTLDHLQKTYIQPILPFKADDLAILNIKIFTPENGFINPNELVFKYKLNPINNEDKSSYTNPRICEYEDVCFHWKILSYLPQQNVVLEQLKEIFEPGFKIIRIQYEDIGYLIFKVMLKADKEGVIQNKEELGISLKIRGKQETVMNEIKKNNLLFETRNEFELREGDIVLFYLTNNNSKAA